METEKERYFFIEAIKEAREAFKEGEVPIGCVITYEDQIIARAHNRTESLNDPTAHAEIIALGIAGTHLNNWRLTGCKMYITLEPCLMCTGALILSRISEVIYLLEDPKFGAIESRLKIDNIMVFNHNFKVRKFYDDELKQDVRNLMKTFFQKLR
ncbi:MAG: nucleoside deaminase [candidate division WOR-3 bacterium]